MISPGTKRILELLNLHACLSCADLQAMIGITHDAMKKKIGNLKNQGLVVPLPKERGQLMQYECTPKAERELLPEDDRPPMPIVPPRTWTPQPIMTAAEVPRMQSNREGSDRAARIKSLGAF